MYLRKQEKPKFYNRRRVFTPDGCSASNFTAALEVDERDRSRSRSRSRDRCKKNKNCGCGCSRRKQGGKIIEPRVYNDDLGIPGPRGPPGPPGPSGGDGDEPDTGMRYFHFTWTNNNNFPWNWNQPMSAGGIGAEILIPRILSKNTIGQGILSFPVSEEDMDHPFNTFFIFPHDVILYGVAFQIAFLGPVDTMPDEFPTHILLTLWKRTTGNPPEQIFAGLGGTVIASLSAPAATSGGRWISEASKLYAIGFNQNLAANQQLTPMLEFVNVVDGEYITQEIEVENSWTVTMSGVIEYKGTV